MSRSTIPQGSRTPAAAADIDIPLPQHLTGACWADTARRMEAQARRLDQLQCATLAMDAGDRSAHISLEPPPERVTLRLPPDVPARTVPEQIEDARQAGYASGLRAGVEYRCWQDMVTGAIWGAGLLAIALLSCGAAGFLSVRFG